ncbi:MAG: hypothetical protein ACOYM3_32120 [Terrimicrobiaceae bacterium]
MPAIWLDKVVSFPATTKTEISLCSSAEASSNWRLREPADDFVALSFRLD